MHFYIDRIAPHRIEGWAQAEHGQPVSLEFRINGELAGVASARRYRQDLQEAGVSEGDRAFVFSPPYSLKEGDALEVRVVGSPTPVQTLNVGPMPPLSPATAAAYELAGELDVLGKPYWRAVLIEQPDGTSIVQPNLLIPPSSTLEAFDLFDLNSGTPIALQATFAPPIIEDTYWFHPGAKYSAAAPISLNEGRQRLVLRESGRPIGSPLDYVVVPSVADLDQFRFAGQTRAARVAGGDDTRLRFAAGGLTIALQLIELTEALPGLSASSAARVLDWGSGAGRVLQFLAKERPAWTFIGADIDTVNVAWCRENIAAVAEFRLLDLMPPTDIEASSLDLVYGMSVITHLTREARTAWIGELARIVKPGGYVVLTYMGPFMALHAGIGDPTPEIYLDLIETGFSDRSPDVALGIELANYYRGTFNTSEDVRAEVDPYFEVVQEHPRTLAFAQDLLVLRRH